MILSAAGIGAFSHIHLMLQCCELNKLEIPLPRQPTLHKYGCTITRPTQVQTIATRTSVVFRSLDARHLRSVHLAQNDGHIRIYVPRSWAVAYVKSFARRCKWPRLKRHAPTAEQQHSDKPHNEHFSNVWLHGFRYKETEWESQLSRIYARFTGNGCDFRMY